MDDAARIDGVQAVLFDAYGTLFDVHAPMRHLARRIGEGAEALSALWRRKQLEYTWLRSLMGVHADFSQVTAEALDHAMTVTGLADAGLRGELLDLYAALDAYPDARRVLAALKAAGKTTGILSNGSPAMLAGAVASAGLEAVLDRVVSVEEVGVYKPDPKVYALGAARVGAAPGEICFVSANAWDVAGAAHCGLAVVWLNRLAVAPENLPGRPRAVVKSLDDLMNLLG